MKKTFVEKCKETFEAYGDESTRDTYHGELSYETGKIFYMLVIFTFMWLFYIPLYLIIHPRPAIAVACTITFSVLCATSVALKFTPPLKNHPRLLLSCVILFFQLLTAIVVTSAGGSIAVHIASFGLSIMIPVFMPLTLRFKISALSLSMAFVFLTAVFFDLDWSDGNVQFVVIDMLVVRVVIAMLFSWNQDKVRRESWLYKQSLKAMIAEREKNLEEISDLAHKAEAANIAKSAFLANINHEIRTPINAVMGMHELALRESDPSAIKERIFTAKQSASILLTIISDVLDFSKIEAGKLEIMPKDYKVATLLSDTVNIIRMAAGKANISFAVRVDSGMPHTLHGDETRICQVLLNLLNNAVKYTEEGYVMLTVTGQFVDDDTINITYEVTDTGIGIKQEDLAKLYNDFTQFDLEKHRGVEGVGLGLALSSRIVNMMGGGIDVTSEYGKGSTFAVTLPQKYHSREVLAKVDNPERLSVLVYERRDEYADSLIWSLDNLCVDCERVAGEADLHDKMKQGSYDYLFITHDLYKICADTISKFQKATEIIVLTEFDEASHEKNVRGIAIPAYCTSIADILNAAHSQPSFADADDRVPSFTAPGAKVLVVDDILTNLIVTEGLLLPYGIRVDLCESGAAAIEAVLGAYKSGVSERYDLIFMDQKMPKMDGVEATKRIRSMPDDPYFAEVPIIALTANAVSGIEELFLESGFNDFLLKPIDTALLDAALGKWIPKNKVAVQR